MPSAPFQPEASIRNVSASSSSSRSLPSAISSWSLPSRSSRRRAQLRLPVAAQPLAGERLPGPGGGHVRRPLQRPLQDPVAGRVGGGPVQRQLRRRTVDKAERQLEGRRSNRAVARAAAAPGSAATMPNCGLCQLLADRERPRRWHSGIRATRASPWRPSRTVTISRRPPPNARHQACVQAGLRKGARRRYQRAAPTLPRCRRPSQAPRL